MYLPLTSAHFPSPTSTAYALSLARLHNVQTSGAKYRTDFRNGRNTRLGRGTVSAFAFASERQLRL